MENIKTPPPCTDATDGTSVAALLKAISENSECAHILAEIAAGGDPRQLLASLLKPDEEVEKEKAADEPQVAMFQSPSQQASEMPKGESCPSFLANIRPDFWDNF